MADPTYEMEMSGVKTFLAMQSDSKDYSKDDSILNDSDHVSLWEFYFSTFLAHNIHVKTTRRLARLMTFISVQC